MEGFIPRKKICGWMLLGVCQILRFEEPGDLVMERFWSVFWKAFGAAVLLAITIGILMGLISHSPETAYEIVQKTLAVGLGICGVIGFWVVPIIMYIEDRAEGGETENASE
jgi:hypothetical protein